MFDSHSFFPGRRGAHPRRSPEGHDHRFGTGFRPGPDGAGPFGPGFGPGPRGGFGPGLGPRGRSRARRGDVRLVLISILGDAPAKGYGLIRAIAERTEGRWRPSPGSVYPTLQQLVDEGLVEGSGSGRGDTYSLTDEGRRLLADSADQIAAAWGGLPGSGEQPDDPLWSSFLKLAGAVRQLSGEATPEQRAAAVEELDRVRKSLYGMLAE
ncbi:MAG: PadR family transcriptional regulator [Naasia sp.]|nr:PadR family transcriptional regulator [Naasia sp.]